MHVLNEAVKYLSIMIPPMIVGIILVDFIIAMKLTDKFAFLVKPITRFAHLRDECGLSFLTAFGSPTAANAMLFDLYDKKVITKKELFISSMANSFPGILMHSRSMLPILIVFLGTAGLVYFGILVFAGFIKTTIIFLIGRLLLDRKSSYGISFDNHDRPKVRKAFVEGIKSSWVTIKKILLIMIPVTIVVFILIDKGAFEMLALKLRGLSNYLPIPSEGLTIIGTQFGSSIAAYTVASNLLKAGILNGREIILTFLIGSVLTSVVRLRFLIPYYMGIFGPKLGFQIMGVSIVLRESIIILIILGLLIF